MASDVLYAYVSCRAIGILRLGSAAEAWTRNCREQSLVLLSLKTPVSFITHELEYSLKSDLEFKLLYNSFEQHELL